MRIDVHCHIGQRCRPHQPGDRLSFEPVEGYAPHDAFLSERIRRGLGMRIASRLMGLPPNLPDAEADRLIEELLLRHMLDARHIDRLVVLAFDQYHTDDGRPLGPRTRDQRYGSDLYVSNTYVREVCRRHPERLLFGASIHPYRSDGARRAVDMLDEAAGAGAVLVKWLPPAQNIHAEDPRTVTFLRRAAQLGVTMLIHCGGEYVLGNMHPEHQDPSGLLRTLRLLRDEGNMPTVIVAHVATPASWPVGSARTFRIMLDALTGEFADDPLYADISALGLFSRARWLKRLAAMPEVHDKLVYGSDFPVPCTPLAFRWRLGRVYHRIQAMPSWIDRDVTLKASLGFEERVFTRGGALLAERITAAAALNGV